MADKSHLDLHDARRVAAAEGYAMLGMWQDAEAELGAIGPAARNCAEASAVRLQIYHGLQKWELMRSAARDLARNDSENVQWTISLAYATRRCESIDAARLILLAALERHPDEATLHYNLACYDCQLGDLTSAITRLEKAFELGPGYRRLAVDDTDLQPLWNSI